MNYLQNYSLVITYKTKALKIIYEYYLQNIVQKNYLWIGKVHV